MRENYVAKTRLLPPLLRLFPLKENYYLGCALIESHSTQLHHPTNWEIDSSSPSQVLDKLRTVLVVYFLTA